MAWMLTQPVSGRPPTLVSVVANAQPLAVRLLDFGRPVEFVQDAREQHLPPGIDQVGSFDVGRLSLPLIGEQRHVFPARHDFHLAAMRCGPGHVRVKKPQAAEQPKDEQPDNGASNHDGPRKMPALEVDILFCFMKPGLQSPGRKSSRGRNFRSGCALYFTENLEYDAMIGVSVLFPAPF
jgi:hypothetical protein